MPIYVYICSSGCGQRVELITTSVPASIPPQITKKCPRCGTASAFGRTITAPVVKTPTTTAVARRNDYRRAKPNAADNVIAGKTADGRPLHARKKRGGIGASNTGRGDWKNRGKGAVKPELVEFSETQWSEAITERYGHTEKPKESEAVKDWSHTYPKVAGN